MIEQYLRVPYQRIVVNPVAIFLSKNERLSANFVTFISALSGVAAAMCVLAQLPIMAVILLLISGYCDTLDGTLARMTNSSTPAGSVFDIIADRIVEFAIIFALFAVAPVERGVFSMFMLGSVLLCVTSFLVVGVFTENEGSKGFHYSEGLMERAEAFFFFIIMILLPAGFAIASVVFSVLVLLTALLRVVEFTAHQKQIVQS